MSALRFNYEKQSLFLHRAAKRKKAGAGFLHREASAIIGERLAVIERKFSNPILLFDGIFAEEIEETIQSFSPPIQGDFQKIRKPKNDILDLEPNSIDLAISIFDLHRVNDLPAILFQITHALKPDGLFMAVLPSDGSLTELRESILKAEIEETGGAGLRIDAFPHIRQLGDLLQKTGFKLPVADVEERTIRYSALSRMINDFRDTGVGNVSSEAINPIAKKSFLKAEKLYKSEYSDTDGKLRASVNLACLSGWKEDISQQKPLKPGSAKHQLKNFI